MLTVCQVVREASVLIAEQRVAQIAKGLVVFCGFEPKDNDETLARMLERYLHYRIFNDAEGKMNQSLTDLQGELLLVPQFTLMADTKKGLRPSFSKGAPSSQGALLFASLKELALANYPKVSFGQFGANMQIYLCNDGPATFLLNF